LTNGAGFLEIPSNEMAAAAGLSRSIL